jgi:hypothetical protein
VTSWLQSDTTKTAIVDKPGEQADDHGAKTGRMQ